jgi:hypothetical protein
MSAPLLRWLPRIPLTPSPRSRWRYRAPPTPLPHRGCLNRCWTRYTERRPWRHQLWNRRKTARRWRRRWWQIGCRNRLRRDHREVPRAAARREDVPLASLALLACRNLSLHGNGCGAGDERICSAETVERRIANPWGAKDLQL